MTINTMISAIQSSLKIQADGKAGPETWTAIYNHIVQPIKQETMVTLLDPGTDRLDERSEKNIATLVSEVQPYARALVHKAASVGIEIRVISGLRTYAEQDALYAQGRTASGEKVTNAKGGESNHNFGIAFDIGIFEGAAYLDESPKYKTVGMLGVDLGLEWGGNWKTIHDQPHFQLRPDWANTLSEYEMLAELRSRKEAGENYYA